MALTPKAPPPNVLPVEAAAPNAGVDAAPNAGCGCGAITG